MIMKYAICLLSALTAFSVYADDMAYQVPVARLQGNLACTVGLADKSFDCTVHAAGKGTMNVDMMAAKNKAGEVVGYYGIDKLSENGVNYTMVVMAGADQGVQGLSLVTDTMTQAGTLEASFVSTSASSLQALNISPLKVDLSDMSAIKISLGFSIYAKPQAAIMQSANSQDVINLIIERLTPYLLTLKK